MAYVSLSKSPAKRAEPSSSPDSKMVKLDTVNRYVNHTCSDLWGILGIIRMSAQTMRANPGDAEYTDTWNALDLAADSLERATLRLFEIKEKLTAAGNHQD